MYRNQLADVIEDFLIKPDGVLVGVYLFDISGCPAMLTGNCIKIPATPTGQDDPVAKLPFVFAALASNHALILF